MRSTSMCTWSAFGCRSKRRAKLKGLVTSVVARRAGRTCLHVLIADLPEHYNLESETAR
jgi:hypothetical protein